MPLSLFLFTFLLPFIFCLLDFLHISKRNKLFFFLFEILLLVTVASLKDENTSFDTENYIQNFVRSGSFTDFFSIEIFRYEPGYTFLEMFVKEIFNDYTYLFFIVSSFSLSILSFLIWKYSPYPFLSLFTYVAVYYFKRDIITIRYGLACVLLLAAMVEGFNNRKISCIFWAVSSFLFHYTALSFIVFVPVFSFFRKRIKVFEYLLVCAFLSSMLGITILGIIIFLQELLPPFFAYAVSKATFYLDIEEGAGIKQIVPFLPICVIFHKLKLLHKSEYLDNFYMCFLFALFMMIELNQAASFSRINQMYLSSIILFYPLILIHIRNRYNFIIFYSYVLLCSFYVFIRMSFFNEGGFINVY